MVDSMRCPGCGTRVVIPDAPRIESDVESDIEPDAEPDVIRDGMLTASPGRATITRAGEVLHRCAPGRFLPPDKSP